MAEDGGLVILVVGSRRGDLNAVLGRGSQCRSSAEEPDVTGRTLCIADFSEALEIRVTALQLNEREWYNSIKLCLMAEFHCWSQSKTLAR